MIENQEAQKNEVASYSINTHVIGNGLQPYFNNK